MKRHSQVTLALLPLGLAAQAAHGQGSYNFYPASPPVQAQIEAGAAVPIGVSARYLDTGPTVGAGVLIHPVPGGPFGLRASFDYARLNTNRELLEEASAVTGTGIRGGRMEIYTLHINALLESQLSPYTRGYLTAGVGTAYERVDFDERFGGREEAVFPGRRDDNRFTWNAGAGLSFYLGGLQSLFLEATYERINTPQPTTYVPVRLGVRF